MKSAYIVDIVRTPVGKFGGSLSSVRPDDMAAHVIKELLKRSPGFDPTLLEDVVFGAANQAGEDNRNVARMAGLLAGLPIEVGGGNGEPPLRIGLAVNNGCKPSHNAW